MVSKKNRIPKTSMRTLLPVASAGLAFLWAWMFMLVLGLPAANQIWHIVPIRAGLSIAFFMGGALYMALVALGKTARLLSNPAFLASTALALALPSSIAFAAYSTNTPVEIALCAWVLAGASFALVLTAYSELLSIDWRRDVGMYHGFGAMLGALLFYLSCHVERPASYVTVLLLAGFSLSVLVYLKRHVLDVKSADSERSSDHIVMYRMTGLTIAVYGLLFGAVIYVVILRVPLENIAGLSAIAIATGSALHILNSVILRRYLPFGAVEKLMLLVLVVAFMAALAASQWFYEVLYLALFALFVYFDIADLSALTALASTNRNKAGATIGRGRTNIFCGIVFGISGCAALQFATIQENGSFPDALALASLGILLLLAVFTVFMPVKDNHVTDKASTGHRAESILDAKCAEASRVFKLSARESEVLVFLAKGRNAEYIGAQLCISMYTAKAHIYHIYRKMSINSQAELMDIVDQIEVPL